MTAAGKDAASPQIPIIAHTDVKRMLLAQKAITEGGLALGLICASLVDDEQTGSPEDKAQATLLLELLTPIAKAGPANGRWRPTAWPFRCWAAMATRDFPVEQYWRDNRLNMIHEGTHGIQGLDLLGRKVIMNNGQALAVLGARITQTIQKARVESLAGHAKALGQALNQVAQATQAAWSTGQPEEALANATPYLQALATRCWPGSGWSWAWLPKP